MHQAVPLSRGIFVGKCGHCNTDTSFKPTAAIFSSFRNFLLTYTTGDEQALAFYTKAAMACFKGSLSYIIALLSSFSTLWHGTNIFVFTNRFESGWKYCRLIGSLLYLSTIPLLLTFFVLSFFPISTYIFSYFFLYFISLDSVYLDLYKWCTFL